MDTLRKRIGERIRDLRLARGLTQPELAERSDVGYKYIGNVENGRGNPTLRWLERVIRGLGVTAKELVVDEDPRPLAYQPLSGDDYSSVREARDSLEAILRRYGEPADEQSAKGSYIRPPRRRDKRR